MTSPHLTPPPAALRTYALRCDIAALRCATMRCAALRRQDKYVMSVEAQRIFARYLKELHAEGKTQVCTGVL